MPVDGALNAPGLMAEVTNTRSRHTMGDDQPRPGTSVDHATFRETDQVSGRDDASAIPDPAGPRNCGHPDGPLAEVKTDVRTEVAISNIATSTRCGNERITCRS